MATNEYAYNRSLIIGVTTVILILAVVSYALRLYARRVSGARIWWDDCTIGIGLVSLKFSPLQVVPRMKVWDLPDISFSASFLAFAIMLVSSSYHSFQDSLRVNHESGR